MLIALCAVAIKFNVLLLVDEQMKFLNLWLRHYEFNSRHYVARQDVSFFLIHYVNLTQQGNRWVMNVY